jgi:hypothetical protein
MQTKASQTKAQKAINQPKQEITTRFFKPSLSLARTRFKEITNWVKIGFC